MQAGIEFLWLVAHGDLKRLRGKVIVIGGGNTAIDCARSALRLGASDVMVAYRRTIDQMPAEEEEVAELLEEGIKIQELTDIDEILVDDRGCVRGIRARLQELGSFDASGRRRPRPKEGHDSAVVFECEHLLTAISQKIDLEFAPELAAHRNGTLKIDPRTFRTSDPQVWGSGDVLTLANLPVAIGHGEEVAVSIEQTLNPGKIKSFPWREVHSPDVPLRSRRRSGGPAARADGVLHRRGSHHELPPGQPRRELGRGHPQGSGPLPALRLPGSLQLAEG